MIPAPTVIVRMEEAMSFLCAHFLHALKFSVWGYSFMNTNVRRLVYLAVFCAVSVALIYLIHLPIFPSAPFLEYDPADIPLMIATFMFGPLWGLAATAAASFIQACTVSSGSGVIGFFMHVFATGAYVIVAGLLYQRMGKGLRATIVSLAVASLVAVAVMIPLNLIFTPMYGTPIDVVKSMMWPVIVPFNLIKFGINSVLTAVVYRSVRYAIRKR